ncbi:bifunctional metallophosphatase/5'-nucleotidase [[Mycoplasma] mobile]|uniref:5'-nucleotidase n=1 Tax=Mycoplasma mobile (strain ATCC 43663 / 163K / NCTC 11711) TaxID=267748 RepID=Q6KIJ1_MYCM1|nr:bifunctional UDP-sugar hydrolase/5'-nucleotidase [[Mycoplasma] mobile]AAT27585.1 5'-nucleotidase [Mycoplasma mobile 163K]
MKKSIKKFLIGSGISFSIITPSLTIIACSSVTQINKNESTFLEYVNNNITKTDIEDAVNNRLAKLKDEVSKWNENNLEYLKINIVNSSAFVTSFENGTFSYVINFDTQLQGINYTREEKATNQKFIISEDVQGSKDVGFELELKQTNSRISTNSIRSQFRKNMINARNFLINTFLDKTNLDDFDKDHMIVKNISINHTNDIHGRFTEDQGQFNRHIGLNNFAAYFNTKNPDLLLDAGDYFQGTGVSDRDKGRTASIVANIIGFDGISAGNHEFDWGKETFLEYSQMAPFYSSNVKYIDTLGTEIANQSFIPGTKIKTIKGDLQVGLIPLTTEDTEFKTNPAGIANLKWENVIETTRSQIASLKAMGINLIVVYGHLGDDATSVRTSIQLAEAIDEIDLIIDGHSHQRYEIGKKVNNAFLVQTGDHTRHIGEVNFDFDKSTGKIVNYANKYINLDEFLLEKDSLKRVKEADEQIATAAAAFEKTSSTEAFKFGFDLATGVLNNGTVERTVRTLETNIGNFVSDSLKYWVENNTNLRQVEGEPDPKIISIFNGGGIRSSIDVDASKNFIVTNGQILAVSPFNNFLKVVKITGKDLKELFRISATKWQDGGFLQVSNNLEVNYSLNAIANNNSNNAILATNSVTSIKYEGVEILDSDEFNLAINDFLQAGGDGFNILKTQTEIVSGRLLTQVITEYGKALETLSLDPNSKYRDVNYEKIFIRPNEATRIKINPSNDLAKEIINRFNSIVSL